MAKWRDIFSVEDWSTLYKNKELPENKQANSLLKEITEKIASYHQINKADINLFSTRRAALVEINHLCEKYKEILADKLKTKDDQKDTSLENGAIDEWVISLGKQALKKEAYLQKLKSHYKNNIKKKYHSAPDLFNELKKREKRHGSGEFLSLHGGTLLERLDPENRAIEFVTGQVKLFDPSQDIKTRADANPMNAAFYAWHHSDQNHIPFYIWLETHPICTASPEISPAWHHSYKNKVRSISYNLKEAYTVKIINDQLQVIKKGNKTINDGELLTTTKQPNLKFKFGSPYGSTAFVWNKEDKNVFISHPHSWGEYHHSSLSKGKKVRSSGLWIVTDGKVKLINNSSGHYKPTSLNFYCLIRFLHDKNVLANDCRVGDFLKPQITVGTATFSRYLPLEEYLQWAEDLPEVQKYLQGNNLQVLKISCNARTISTP